MEKAEFVKKIKIRQVEIGMTNKQLSAKTGIDYDSLMIYLNAKKTTFPNMPKVELIAKALDTSISYLTEDEKVNEPSENYGFITENEILRKLWKHVFNEEYRIDKNYIISKLASKELF